MIKHLGRRIAFIVLPTYEKAGHARNSTKMVRFSQRVNMHRRRAYVIQRTGTAMIENTIFFDRSTSLAAIFTRDAFKSFSACTQKMLDCETTEYTL
jgi:hypothetical protein